MFDSLCASPIRDYTEEGDQRDKKNWLEFVSVECPDYETAIKIIDVARYRAHHRVRPQKDRDNCHLFLRYGSPFFYCLIVVVESFYTLPLTLIFHVTKDLLAIFILLI